MFFPFIFSRRIFTYFLIDNVVQKVANFTKFVETYA